MLLQAVSSTWTTSSVAPGGDDLHRDPREEEAGYLLIQAGIDQQHRGDGNVQLRPPPHPHPVDLLAVTGWLAAPELDPLERPTALLLLAQDSPQGSKPEVIPRCQCTGPLSLFLGEHAGPDRGLAAGECLDLGGVPERLDRGRVARVQPSLQKVTDGDGHVHDLSLALDLHPAATRCRETVEAYSRAARHAQGERFVDHDQVGLRQALGQVLGELQVLVSEEAHRSTASPELLQVTACGEVLAELLDHLAFPALLPLRLFFFLR